MNKVVLIDIDGVILHEYDNPSDKILKFPKLLPGVRSKIDYWRKLGHYIILLTAREECLRKLTEECLFDQGIIYNRLIMGIPNGDRYVINNSDDPLSKPTAFARNIRTNYGLEGINI